MKKAPYQSSVWMRTDSSGLTVQVNGRNPFDGGFLSFETPADGVEFIENLSRKIKNVVPIEDVQGDLFDSEHSNGLAYNIERQYDLFCSGRESSARMVKIKTHRSSVVYRDCGYDDIVCDRSDRKLGTIHVDKRCFGDTPPEFITVRISDSLPMNIKQ